MLINLGDAVVDTVSGFKGVVLAKMEAVYEATSCRVHDQATGADGNPKSGIWLEEARLLVTKPQTVTGFLEIRGKA